MLSVVTGIAIAAVMFGVALYKGRTGWHWFALSLFAFATTWLLSVVVLYAANVQLSLVRADKSLAGFAGAVTCGVIFILLVCVPYRPRKSASALDAMRRGPTP
jgi:hypothetical protein